MEFLGIIAFILALLTSVMFHELGHFLTARKFGMRVSEFFVGFGYDFAGVCLDNVACNHAAHEEVFWHADVRGGRLLELAGVTHGNPLVFGNNHFA